jgi:SAM-dependent methyltransferase
METAPDPWRERARGFGTQADLYDQARPSYPAALVDELLTGHPVDVLDVGCGTGKAGRLFVGAGRRVLGVEPDPRMAALARSHGVEVEVSGFETWENAGRRFDLLVSAQAWHWVDPVAGAVKAAEVLRPGGRLAVFWNELRHLPSTVAVFQDVYGRHRPDFLRTSFALGVIDSLDAERDEAGLALAAGPFDGVTPGQRRHFWRDTSYTPREWVELVSTHSDHRLLDDDTRIPLLRDLEEALGGLGPSFPVRYRTDLLSGVRRASAR